MTSIRRSSSVITDGKSQVDSLCLCLKVEVTKCQRGEDALLMIRENKGGFDIVLTDVHMPGMNGLQLLAEIADMGVTLPVIVFSSDTEKDTVVKGVYNGACDFLVKPIQINTLKVLWQHVLRSNRSLGSSSIKELETPPLAPTTSSSNDTHTQAEHEEENSKSLKRSSEDEADHDQSRSSAKKPRLVWTPELNETFTMAVNILGIDDAKPKNVLEIMRKMTSVPLTRQNVSSHLQKYRMNFKKMDEASEHQSAHSSLIHGHGFADQTHSAPPSSSLVTCGGIQNCAASTQFPSQAMSITPRQQCACCSMRMPDLVQFPDSIAPPMCQTGLQSEPLATLQQPNPLLQNHGCQPQVNESAQCPSYAPAPSIGFNSPENAAARHHLAADTHPHPMHSQIPTHDIQSHNSSTPHLSSEQGLPVAKANEICGSNDILAIKGEFSYWNDHNQVAEDCQVYSNEAMFADLLDMNIFEDLGFGEGMPFLDSYITDNGVI
ncbi:hypothetical protein BT93_H0084 [Corymbia citriodora subsp. variegata]|nr:hypothetical protein BT93_H0084 [Corymbia citriodora subsp. variegata]